VAIRLVREGRMSDEQQKAPPGAAPVDEAKRALRDEMRGVREERRVAISQFELREVPNGAGGTNLKFEGYASVTCAAEDDFTHAYEMEDWLGPYTESVLRGAFSKTLTEGADVAFLVNHGGVTMARTKPGTLRLFEDLVGLNVDATLNPSRGDVGILRAAVEDGAVDEMSFAFRVVRQKWSYAEENGVIDRRFLQELNLDKGDVSPVNYGANPHTGGLVSMRGAMGALLSGRGLTAESWVTALREIRAGAVISRATFEALQPVHDYLTQGDDHADTLADLLDLKDDDDDGDGAASASGPEALSLTLATLPDHGERARTRLAGLRR
jgi:HK97 family phage prohead protease